MLKIKIYPDNKHQVLAIPIKGKVADMFLDKLDIITKEKYDKNIEYFIKKVSFYDNKLGKWKNFVTGVTPRDSEHNFDLISFDEDDNFEINVFKVYAKDFNEELCFEVENNEMDLNK